MNPPSPPAPMVVPPLLPWEGDVDNDDDDLRQREWSEKL